jgi:hypothetical protein
MSANRKKGMNEDPQTEEYQGKEFVRTRKQSELTRGTHNLRGTKSGG